MLPVLGSQQLIINDITETRTVFLQYDDFGNKVHAVLGEDEDIGDHVFYLWSYRGLYPIAEVLGCRDYNAFKTAVETSFGMGIDTIPYMYSVSRTSLDSLRNHPSLTAAHVTTSLYDPLVGITELTDPTGITTYFGYDDAGRLIETYIIAENGSKEIIQSNIYHLVNQ